MDGIVRMTGQLPAEAAQGRAASKKRQARPQGRKICQRRSAVHAPPPLAPTGQVAGRVVGMSPNSHMRMKMSLPIQASVAA